MFTQTYKGIFLGYKEMNPRKTDGYGGAACRARLARGGWPQLSVCRACSGPIEIIASVEDCEARL